MHSNVARNIYTVEKIYVQTMAWYTGWGRAFGKRSPTPQPVGPLTQPQWVRGIYRPNIQDTVITVIGLYGIGLGLLLYM